MHIFGVQHLFKAFLCFNAAACQFSRISTERRCVRMHGVLNAWNEWNIHTKFEQKRKQTVNVCVRLRQTFWYFFLLGLEVLYVRQSTRTPREDRARRINLYERFKIVYFLLSFSLYLTLCISITISQSPQPTVSKENAKDFSFVLTQTHAHTQHHDAAIWSHVSLSVKWSLLFRYCAVQHSSVQQILLCDCVWLSVCAFASTSLFLPVEPVLLIIHITVREYLLNKVFHLNQSVRASKKPRILVIFQKVYSAIKWRWSLNFVASLWENFL